MSDSLIQRWSKKKSQVAAEEENLLKEAQQEQSDAIADNETEDGAANKKNDEENKEPVELPPIESLGDDSDYSMFMSPEVDEGLKKIALRKLFKAPFFNVVDGLNDYDDDFTTFEALGDIVTSDMKFHEERKKAEQALKEQQSVEPEEVVDSDDVETLATDTDTDEEKSRVVESEIEKQQAREVAQADDQEDHESSDPSIA